jgi:hypothetical protein
MDPRSLKVAHRNRIKIFAEPFHAFPGYNLSAIEETL